MDTKKGTSEKSFRMIWWLLAGFVALSVLVLVMTLTARNSMPQTVGRKLTEEETRDIVENNSPLTDYVYLSPNATFPREDEIRKITIHHMAMDLPLETLGETFAQRDRRASSNYAIDTNGYVGLYVEEENAAWTSSSSLNDNQAVTIEVANDETGGDWHVSDMAYDKLIDLCVDICERNGIAELNYTGDDTGNLTIHSMFNPDTECPGPYLKSKMSDIAEAVNSRLSDA